MVERQCYGRPGRNPQYREPARRLYLNIGIPAGGAGGCLCGVAYTFGHFGLQHYTLKMVLGLLIKALTVGASSAKR